MRFKDIAEKHITADGNFLAVYVDDRPIDPRDEYADALTGRLVLREGGGLWYSEIPGLYLTGYRERDEELIREFFGPNVIFLPVFKFEHSGIAFNTVGFNCPWDSGHAGYIIADPEKVAEFGGTVEDIEKTLRMEVEEYSNYVNGEAYGFIEYDRNGTELNSCWGFLGADHAASGLYDSAEISKETVRNWKVKTCYQLEVSE